MCSSMHVSMISRGQAQVRNGGGRCDSWGTHWDRKPLPGWAHPSSAHGAQTRLHSTCLLLFPPRSQHQTFNKCSSVEGIKSVFILLKISCQVNRPVSRLQPKQRSAPPPNQPTTMTDNREIDRCVIS